MSINDEMIIPYLELLTDVTDGEIAQFSSGMRDGKLNPMTVKKRLAHELVRDFWSVKDAEEAAGEFARTVQHREAPEEIPTLEVPAGSEATLSAELVRAGLAKSRTEARRLMQQNAVEIDGKSITEDIGINKVAGGSIIRVGKRRFIKIVKK